MKWRCSVGQTGESLKTVRVFGFSELRVARHGLHTPPLKWGEVFCLNDLSDGPVRLRVLVSS